MRGIGQIIQWYFIIRFIMWALSSPIGWIIIGAIVLYFWYQINKFKKNNGGSWNQYQKDTPKEKKEIDNEFKQDKEVSFKEVKKEDDEK